MHHVAIVGVDDLYKGAVGGDQDRLAIRAELEPSPFDVLISNVFGDFEVRKWTLNKKNFRLLDFEKSRCPTGYLLERPQIIEFNSVRADTGRKDQALWIEVSDWSSSQVHQALVD